MASWREIKEYQLAFGDIVNTGAYDWCVLPAVRCFWIGSGNTNVMGSVTILSLARDLTNVFGSHFIWEYDAGGVSDEAPGLRDVYETDPHVPPPPTPQWSVGRTLLFPLWPKMVDATGMTYRLVEPNGTGQTQILGTVSANVFQWRPDHYSPSNSFIRVELLRDGITITNKTFLVHVSGTDGDGMPNDWELRNFQTLARDGLGDWDLDGFRDIYEYVAGTSPTNGEEYLHISSIHVDGPWANMQWASVTGRMYRLHCASNLLAGWQTNGSQVAGSGGLITITSSVSSGSMVYRLGVNLANE